MGPSMFGNGKGDGSASTGRPVASRTKATATYIGFSYEAAKRTMLMRAEADGLTVATLPVSLNPIYLQHYVQHVEVELAYILLHVGIPRHGLAEVELGGPRVSGGRRVVVGNSAVSLKSFTYQPPGEVPRTAVLAHCPQSSCAVLYAELAKEAQEEARTTRDAVCVRAARLHGGERLVSISSVDTEALPGSGGAAFVWLGADHRLALGRVDSALRLRHVHARLNAHPTALAYHPGCRCAVALVDRTPRGKSASPRSSLQLHQIDNLCEPRKHFVIISSYVYGALQDAADPDSGGGTAARAVGVRGVLTVYEVQWRRKGETRDEFQLVLHGTCALRSVCHCLQWMPSPSCKGGADEDRVLLAGGHDALYMYSLRVDDGSTAGKGVVADALRVINSAATAPLPLLAAPEDDEEEVDSEGGKAHFIERERRRAQAAFERGGGAASTALPDGAPGGTGPNAPAADNAGGAEPLTANPQAAPGATPGPEDAAEPVIAGAWAAAHQMPGLVAAQRALQAVPQSAFVPDCMRLVQHAEHWNSSLCSYDELDDDREYLNGHGGSAGTDQRSRSANDLENDIATGVSSSLREPAASDLQPASK
eukprot:gene2199-2909_t